ncbi:B- and T-lymphocyte attenuator-like [Sinocyclocheilus anshuiensis]|uniref:B- and T-lymphocyte attenuator-like n=1 Tax=Sinocyclocheilus anshuiensis TaxID=1608454 RepID=UPI0007B99F94|nr:PREDICTED: B- and T-lymphocyte attenuator-like [Sinocyclocheilus anshuiensis]
MGYYVFQIICNLAVSLLLLSLGISGTTNGTEMNCISVIRVPRNTVFRAPVMTELKINCTLTLQGCHRNPRVSWCKLNGSDCKALNYSHHIRTEWKSITEHEWVAFLIFLNISMEDTGSYRCKEGDTSVSHTINVTVTDKNENEVSRNQSNTRDRNSGEKDDLKWLWPYVYICSGITGLVVIVITVTLLIIRNQGTKSTRKDMTTKNQSKPHHNTHSPSVQLTSALYRGCETPPVRGASSAGRVSDGSHNAVDTEREEENALVYASLNHQAMSRGPRRTARQEPEPSEYAAIRFR